jgi:excisionase family DNA binding protein
MRFIKIAEVCELTGVSPSSIKRWVRDPEMKFPKPIRLGHRDRAWEEDEVLEWLAQRPTADGWFNDAA